MQKAIAFDLETIANPDVLKILGPAEAKLGNLKDPEKIKAKMAEAEQKRLAEMGLNPHHNMIACVGWCDSENSGVITLADATLKAETELLQQLWELLNGYNYFITFNGLSFDVPVINLHSLYCRVRPAVNISTRKYVVGNHFDIRMVLGNWDTYAPGKLDFYLKRILGHGKKEGIDGSMVQHYWDVGLKDEIAEYAVQDAVDTWDLFQVVREYYPH